MLSLGTTSLWLSSVIISLIGTDIIAVIVYPNTYLTNKNRSITNFGKYGAYVPTNWNPKDRKECLMLCDLTAQHAFALWQESTKICGLSSWLNVVLGADVKVESGTELLLRKEYFDGYMVVLTSSTVPNAGTVNPIFVVIYTAGNSSYSGPHMVKGYTYMYSPVGESFYYLISNLGYIGQVTHFEVYLEEVHLDGWVINKAEIYDNQRCEVYTYQSPSIGNPWVKHDHLLLPLTNSAYDCLGPYPL